MGNVSSCPRSISPACLQKPPTHYSTPDHSQASLLRQRLSLLGSFVCTTSSETHAHSLSPCSQALSPPGHCLRMRVEATAARREAVPCRPHFPHGYIVTLLAPPQPPSRVI
ncbi:hypothetical protein KIL84_009074 [Mauremys mutica]|uniref:Uncharacterized protein n=1 Tax=Mauremys mutica TaxID=74926 RepID=A0A9D4B3L1_9SAUR|nr:hypothetical protein KIL84_009074 [Mauremys mutica]